MTTLRIASTGLIYSPGLFAWIMAHGKQDKERKEELLLALGVPEEFVPQIIAGEFVQRTEGETLVITL